MAVTNILEMSIPYFLSSFLLFTLDTCVKNELDNFTSKEIMQQNGWVFNKIDTDMQYCMVNDPNATAECNSDTTWYGWGCELSSGTLITRLKGSGIMNIRYGNCWNDGNVNIYLNDSLIDSASALTYKETTFEYDDETTIKITDEEGNAVIKLIRIAFSCKGTYEICK